jgi:hypothetical protein
MEQDDVCDRLLAKLRHLVIHDLDDEERALFAALVAPAIARAYTDEVEVAGFALTEWSPEALPEALREAIRDRDIRIVGL